MEKGRADPLFDLYFWRQIAKTLLINALTVPTIILILFWSGVVNQSLTDIVETFEHGYWLFFAPLSQFSDFFFEYAVRPALLEELAYRSQIRIAMAFIVLLKKDSKWLWILALWIIGLALNFHWAASHTTNAYVWIPVFTAGVAWLWLVIKTNRLWPSIVCHAVANLSIYFVIKIYQFL